MIRPWCIIEDSLCALMINIMVNKEDSYRAKTDSKIYTPLNTLVNMYEVYFRRCSIDCGMRFGINSLLAE